MIRRTAALLALALIASGRAAVAQTDYYARLGLVGGTALLHDHVVNDIDTKQRLGPTLVLGAAMPLSPKHQAGLELALASTGLSVEENGATASLGSVRTASLLLNFTGQLAPTLNWRLGLGGLRYFPGDKDGLFAQGGSTRALVGAGVDWRRPALPKWDLMASLRYDFHRFSTDELRSRGFTRPDAVHRVSFSVGLARGQR